MKKAPEIFRVLGKRYQLVGVDDPDRAVARGANYSCLGTTEYDRGLVQYRMAGAEVSADEEADTILHELLHVVWLAGGLHEMTGRLDESGERVVRRMAPLLLDTLRSNPELVAYLTEEVPLDGKEEKAPAKAKAT